MSLVVPLRDNPTWLCHCLTAWQPGDLGHVESSQWSPWVAEHFPGTRQCPEHFMSTDNLNFLTTTEQGDLRILSMSKVSREKGRPRQVPQLEGVGEPGCGPTRRARAHAPSASWEAAANLPPFPHL